MIYSTKNSFSFSHKFSIKTEIDIKNDHIETSAISDTVSSASDTVSPLILNSPHLTYLTTVLISITKSVEAKSNRIFINYSINITVNITISTWGETSTREIQLGFKNKPYKNFIRTELGFPIRNRSPQNLLFLRL